MYLDSAKKQEIFGQYGKSNTDTGSAESQVALFSYRISHLTEHMRANRKDHTTERALVKLVGKRRALLNYLKDRDIERYRAIVKALGLRKYATVQRPYRQETQHKGVRPTHQSAGASVLRPRRRARRGGAKPLPAFAKPLPASAKALRGF